MKYVLTFLITLFLLGASTKDARKANEAYRNGNYEQAINLYKKAIQEDEKNAKLYYNLANALAKNGNKDDAIRYYEQYKQMTKDSEEEAKANYNIGNIYSQNKKWDKAIDYYKKAMRGKADDLDAKHNYELAKRQKQQQQQNKKNKKNGQNKKNKKNQKNKNNQQQNNQQKKDQKNKNRQHNQQPKNNDDKQNKQKKQPQPNKMSKAEAENILKALAKQEKELLKQFKKQKTKSSNSTHEKDW